MSDTMSASGVQAHEPRPGMSSQASAAGSPSGTYNKVQNQCADWDYVTIAPDTDRTDVWKMISSTDQAFSSSAGSAPGPFLHVEFGSDTNPGKEFVYASLIDTVDNVGNIITLLTLTYIQYLEGMREPATPQTGVWLGTSSGGQWVYARAKA